MGRKKKVKGVCRLCGNNSDLTFEHVPPQSTYNKHTKYKKIPLEEMMKVVNLQNHEFKGKLYQGGIGYYSLCGDCNSFLGSTYVNSYKRWVNGGFEVLKQGNEKSYTYILKDIEPLKIIKHIISMFLSMNNEWYLEEYPELSKFVISPESTNLPDRYQVFTYLNNEGTLRYLPHQIRNGFDINPVNGTELTFPPYGYVLIMDSELNLDKLTNITKFKNFGLNESEDIKIEMNRLPTYTTFMFDYRGKSEL